jgi:methionine transaminase
VVINKIDFHSKLPAIGTTIFTVMSQLANECGAINLSQGFPDFEVSPELIELVSKHMREGKNQYAPMPGLPYLREQIAAKIFRTYSRKIDVNEEITVTAGGTEALFAAIGAIISPGDEAIVFDPAYDSYDPAVQLNGGKTIHLQLEQPDFSIDYEKLKKAINHKTKLIIINSPHNPTGSVLSMEDLEKMYELTKDTNIILLSDEVYEHIIFDGIAHASVIRHEALYQRSIAVFSFGKTFHATGWKMGYFVAPPFLTKELRKVHQYLNFCVNTPVQYALADFIQNEGHYLNIPDFYAGKRDFFLDKISKSRFKPLPCKGTYFQLLSYKDISEEKDTDMAIRLTKEYGIASIPVSVFNQSGKDEKLLRFCFAKKEETLQKATEILCRI